MEQSPPAAATPSLPPRPTSLSLRNLPAPPPQPSSPGGATPSSPTVPPASPTPGSRMPSPGPAMPPRPPPRQGSIPAIPVPATPSPRTPSPSPSSPTPGARGPMLARSSESSIVRISRQPDSPHPPGGVDSEVTDSTVNPELRKKIAMEILETERSYVGSLESMVNFYIKPLMALPRPDIKVKVKTIFGNMETLLGINHDLLQRLEGRLSEWTDQQCLGDVFMEVAPFLKMYTVYSTQYDAALRLLTSLPETDPQLHEDIERCHAEYVAASGNPLALRLTHMLIMPIQRIPRYNLLLTDFIKKTPPTHPDFEDLKKALASVKDSADRVNKCVQETENLKKLAETSSKTRGLKGLMEAHRKLVYEGLLEIQQSDLSVGDSSAELRKFSFRSTGEKEKYHFYLFNDILVFASERELMRQKDVSKLETNWPLALIWLQVNRDDSFRLIGPNRVFFVLATPEEKAKWVPLLTEQINNALLASGAHVSGDLNDTAVRKASFEFHAGATYSGYWQEGRLCGQGTYSFAGNIYEGEWQDSQKHGRGVLRSASGEIYDGEWCENLAHGDGVLTYPDGTVYRGAFSQGLFSVGLLTWANGDTYQGSFSQGLYHGNGTLRSHNGSCYTGEFKDGMFSGAGTLQLATGLTYKGQWRAGLRNGAGSQQFPDTSSYEGEFSADRFHGKGRFLTADASVYDGQWVEGKREGKGTLTTLAGLRYAGKWKNDLPHGKGEISFSGSESFSGHWKEGKYDGAGVWTRNGIKFDGIWTEGRLENKLVFSLPSQPQTKATVRTPSDLYIQVPGHSLPVFFDFAPALPRFEAGAAFRIF